MNPSWQSKYTINTALAFAVKDQLPRLRKIRYGLWIHRVVRPARPKCVFVHLEALLVDPAEHHRADAAVADRKRLGPLPRHGGTAIA